MTKCDKCGNNINEVAGNILYRVADLGDVGVWRCKPCWLTSKNEIPPMTHPMGRHWDQPKRSEILIDDFHAVMSEATCEKLHAYDHSTPSGVYEGKMWKSRGHLIWFGFSEAPGLFSTNCRKILLPDKPLKVPRLFHLALSNQDNVRASAHQRPTE